MRSQHLRTATVAAAVAALAGLTACSPGSGPDTTVQGLLGQGGGSITVWAGDDQIPALQQVAREYEEDTGVAVRLIQRNANAQMMSDFITQVPTGEGPDVITVPHDALGQMVENGVVAPVELGPRAEEFLDISMQALTYEGTAYGVPFGIENVLLLRNDAMVDSTPDTFDGLVEQGEELIEAGLARYPVLVNQSPESGDPYHLYPLQSSFGAHVFERDADGAWVPELAMGGAEGLAFADYLRDLGARGVVNTAMTPDIALEAFLTGQSPYLISGPWNVPSIRAAGMDVAALNVPSAGGQESQPFVGVQAFFVSAGAGNPLPANDFVTNYLARLDTQLALLESAQRPPALVAALEAIEDDEILSAYAEVAESAGVPMPALPAMGSVWNFWGATQNGIVNGQGDPAALWTTMARNIEGQIG